MQKLMNKGQQVSVLAAELKKDSMKVTHCKAWEILTSE